MFVKPILPKKSTQSQHWQFDGFHFRVFSLKDDKVLAFLISAGIEFQITGPNYRIEPSPNQTELILEIQSFWGPFDLKSYNDSFNWNSSEKSGVERSFNALSISIAKFWIFCSWIVKVPSLDNNSSKLEISMPAPVIYLSCN